jgi:thiol:disulfide interchange protein DsbA
MKRILIIASALLLFSACGDQEATQNTVEAAPPVDQQSVTETVEVAGEPEADTEEAVEALQVVEESAAEPESGEQEILLAQAETTSAPQNWQFEEGVNYARLVPTQPTVGGADKIEVAEFFWYGCPHCYSFEPTINTWADNKPANVRFVRIPAMWNGLVQMHARLYYTEEILGRNGVIKDPAAFRDAVFQEYHLRGNRMASEAAIAKLFERFGVSADDFSRTWGSFEVDQKLRVADDLARRYSIANVPSIVVNGKYRSGAQEAGSYAKLLELMDELVIRESAR